MPSYAYINNANTVVLTMTTEAGAPINDAVLECQILDSSMNPIGNSFALTADGDSLGGYIGTFPSNEYPLMDGCHYTAVVTSSNYDFKDIIQFRASQRINC